MLKENRLNIKKTYSFPDHHNYSKKYFQKILNNNCSKIVTTEKDYYRMNNEQKRNCEYVKVDLKIHKAEEFKQIIESYL